MVKIFAVIFNNILLSIILDYAIDDIIYFIYYSKNKRKKGEKI
ncbi:hypothetical protein SAMN02745163_01228 [Clostridium cavendishii DSM 21758]|uniref:Uncharacterized protein n=1 Tax=Clostridium cavendishii DSM 21758 TaxID=1121302 RepID=A0A1M6GA84_9CLOT|nr:hypothetical protein SAMN02745163_01228 [Clostridium cavendishii DSM 21758]